MSEPLVIVGNGMAAARLVDELAEASLGRYAVAVVGEEPRLASTACCSPRCGRRNRSTRWTSGPPWWPSRRHPCARLWRQPGRNLPSQTKMEGEDSMEYSSSCSPSARRRCGSTCTAPISPAVSHLSRVRDVDLLLTLAAAEKARRRGQRSACSVIKAGLRPAKAGAPGDAAAPDGPLMERQLEVCPVADCCKRWSSARFFASC